MPDNVLSNPGSGAAVRCLADGAGVEWAAGVVAYATTVSAGANVLQVVTPSAGLPVAQQGTWTVTANAGTGTMAVSAAALPLPAGASTSALQTTGNTSLASVDGKTPALGQALAAASVPVVLTAAQIATLTPVTTVTVNQGAAQIGVTWGVAGIVASGSADSGNPVKVGGVYNSSQPTFSTGQRGDLQLDANGNVRVAIVSGGGSGGTASTFGSAFPSTGTAVGFKDSTGANLAAGNLDASGFLKVNVAAGGGSGGTSSSFAAAVPATGTAAGFSDGTNLQLARVFDADSGAGTQYVEGVVLRGSASGGSVEIATASNPLRTDPTGTTTQPVSVVAGTAVIGHVIVDTAPSTAVTNAGVFAVQATQAGTWNVTNVSGTVSLPTGAATSLKQPALGTAGTASSDVITVQGIAAMTALKVDGSGVTQPASLASLPALAAGTALVGSIAAGQQVGTAYSGTTTLTPKYAVINNAAASGDTTVVAAVVSKKITILRWFFQCAGVASVKFTDGAAGTSLLPVLSMLANQPASGAYCPVGHFQGSTNTAFVINSSTAVQVSGYVVYLEV